MAPLALGVPFWKSEQMRIQAYAETDKNVWDDFVRQSKNGTFLFQRDYMDYHRERFQDCSLLIWDEKEALVALLPANREGDTLVSHGGLTYGGFITDDSMKMPRMLQIFEDTLIRLKQNGFSRFVYKTIPHIYHRSPAEEDRYALFLSNAFLTRRGVLTSIDGRHRLPFQERRNRGVKKAKQNGLIVKQSDDFATFWQILTDRLRKTHNTLPVHNLSEIDLLHYRFPNNIKLFSCYKGSVMQAGVVIYESEKVAHVQYIATSDQGSDLCALDLIFAELLSNYYCTKAFFDLGTSDENDGRYLNKGLIDQKEGFGARVVVHDHYEIQLAEWKPGRCTGVMT